MMYEVAPDSRHEAATLEDYLAAVRERRNLVVLLTALGLALGLILATSRTLSYEATATVLVNPSPVGSTIEGRLVDPNLDREVEIVVSDAVARSAVERLGTDEDPLPLRIDLEVEFVPDSDVLQIRYVDTDRDRARDVANSFAESYVAARASEQTNFYAAQTDVLDASIGDLDAQIAELSTEIGLLDVQREQALDDAELTAEIRRAQLDSIATARSALVTERNSVTVERRNLKADLAEMERTRNAESPAAVVLSLAESPRFPLGFSSAVLAVVGMLAGLLLGVITAFLLARLDGTAGDEVSVSQALGTQVVGTVPDMGWRNSKGQAALAMLSKHKTVRIHRAREAYRMLRTSLEFLQRTRGDQTFIITSSHPGEGKSVTSANLAVAVAQGGRSVALINGDMRRPTLETLLGVEKSQTGLSAFLGGMTDDLSVVEVEAVPNLFFVPAGPQPGNPGELLKGERFLGMLKDFAEQVDVVIVDTPPVGATADAAAAATGVDSVLIVVDGKSTSLEELRVTRADLERSGAEVGGAILNRDASRDAGLFDRRRAYSYGRDSAA